MGLAYYLLKPIQWLQDPTDAAKGPEYNKIASEIGEIDSLSHGLPACRIPRRDGEGARLLLFEASTLAAGSNRCRRTLKCSTVASGIGWFAARYHGPLACRIPWRNVDGARLSCPSQYNGRIFQLMWWKTNVGALLLREHTG
jgi:hypothetical protein